MLRQLGFVGFLGIALLLAGFAVLGYVDPVVAGGVALILLGATLVVHAAIKAVATQFGMGDMV